MEFIQNFDVYVIELIYGLGIITVVIAAILMYLSSIFPFLPYAVIMPFLFQYFGLPLGFVIAWILTCLGCFTAFKIIKSGSDSLFNLKIVRKHELILTKWLMIVKNARLEQFVMMLSTPFIPAFLMNIVSAVSGMSKRKYIVGIMIGKVFLLAFWGFIGVSLVESFENPTNLLLIIILLGFAFVVSKLVRKKYGIE